MTKPDQFYFISDGQLRNLIKMAVYRGAILGLKGIQERPFEFLENIEAEVSVSALQEVHSALTYLGGQRLENWP